MGQAPNQTIWLAEKEIVEGSCFSNQIRILKNSVRMSKKFSRHQISLIREVGELTVIHPINFSDNGKNQIASELFMNSLENSDWKNRHLPLCRYTAVLLHIHILQL
jgi:hypothetical protein